MTYSSSSNGCSAQIKVGSNRLTINSDDLAELINVLTIMQTVPDKQIIPLEVELTLAEFNKNKGILAFRKRTGLPLTQCKNIMNKFLDDREKEEE